MEYAVIFLGGDRSACVGTAGVLGAASIDTAALERFKNHTGGRLAALPSEVPHFKLEVLALAICRPPCSVSPQKSPKTLHARLCAKHAVSSRHTRGPAPALRASAGGPEGAALTLRLSPQCSLPNVYKKMIHAFRDMRSVR